MNSSKEPFELPEVPSFPDLCVNILDYGASEQDLASNRLAFAKAISDVSSRGGGRVLVPAGRFRTAAIHLQSGVELHLARGAVLDFSMTYEDYLPPVFGYRGGIRLYSVSHFIYARGAKNIALTGEGVLEGNGSVWWGMVASQPGMKELQIANRDRRPVAERVYATRESGVRPVFLQFIDCENVLIEGVTFKNSPSWTVHPVLCRHLTVRNIRIDNPLKAANTDGIDIESCRRVLVEDCRIKTSDDIVCIKAGRNEDAWDHMPPCEDVLVRRIEAEGFCGGLTVGSETSAGIRRIYFEDCTVKGAQWGIRIKTRASRGSTVEELFYRNITLRSCSRGGIEATLCYSDSFEDLLYQDAYYNDPDRVAARDACGSTVRALFFEGIDCEGVPVGIQLLGEEARPIESVRLTDCRFSCERAANMKNVRDLVCEGLSF